MPDMETKLDGPNNESRFRSLIGDFGGETQPLPLSLRCLDSDGQGTKALLVNDAIVSLPGPMTAFPAICLTYSQAGLQSRTNR